MTFWWEVSSPTSSNILFTLVHLIFMISNLFCKIEDVHCHKGRLFHISFFLPILFSFMVSLQHFFKHKAMVMILRYKIVLHTILFSGCYQCFFLVFCVMKSNIKKPFFFLLKINDFWTTKKDWNKEMFNYTIKSTIAAWAE